MELVGGENILRSDQLVKVARERSSSKEKQFQFYKMKAMCFLLSANQKRYSFLLKQPKDGYNLGRDEYPVTTTSVLDILIRIEGGIRGNQQSSAYENRGGKGGYQHKEHMGHTFTQHKGGTEDNATLVSGKDGTTLNAMCYNFRDLGRPEYNFPEAGRTFKCSSQVIHTFAQKQIHKNGPINDNLELLDICSSASVIKWIFGEECKKLQLRR